MDFSTPKFLNLDYIDVVVEDKSLLLISWKSKRHHKIIISSITGTYRNHETALIVRIPDGVEDLSITLCSFWRRHRYILSFKRLKLDKETAANLIQSFKPISMLELKIPEVNSVRVFRSTRLPAIRASKQNMTVHTPNASIIIDKLTYSKTNQL